MINPEMGFTIKDQALSHLYLYMVISISSTYLLGRLFYAVKFHFWQHAISELGTTRTLTGTPNTISAFLVVLYNRFKLKMALLGPNLSLQSI